MKISKAKFQIARLIKNVEDTKFGLRFLHICERFTEVTDGHFIVRMKLPTEDSDTPTDVLLSPEDAVNISQALTKDEHVRAVIKNDGGDTAQVEFSDGQIRILAAGSLKYPDVEASLPKGKAPFSIAFNPEYLMSILSAFKANESTSVRLDIWSSEKCVRLCESSLTPDESPVLACLMPMRIGMSEQMAPPMPESEAA